MLSLLPLMSLLLTLAPLSLTTPVQLDQAPTDCSQTITRTFCEDGHRVRYCNRGKVYDSEPGIECGAAGCRDLVMGFNVGCAGTNGFNQYYRYVVGEEEADIAKYGVPGKGL